MRHIRLSVWLLIEVWLLIILLSVLRLILLILWCVRLRILLLWISVLSILRLIHRSAANLRIAIRLILRRLRIKRLLILRIRIILLIKVWVVLSVTAVVLIISVLLRLFKIRCLRSKVILLLLRLRKSIFKRFFRLKISILRCYRLFVSRSALFSVFLGSKTGAGCGSGRFFGKRLFRFKLIIRIEIIIHKNISLLVMHNS